MPEQRQCVFAVHQWTPLCEVAVYAHQLAREKSEISKSAVVTVDTFQCEPNSYSVIPKTAEITLDIRDATWESIAQMRNAIIQYAQEMAKKYRVTMCYEVFTEHKPCNLSEEICQCVLETAKKLSLPCMEMNSGAIHDALNIASCVKTGMIFIPSKGGISHSPFEWTDWKWQRYGIDLLTETLKQLSK